MKKIFKTKSYFILMLPLFLLFSSCEKDPFQKRNIEIRGKVMLKNYDEPVAGINVALRRYGGGFFNNGGGYTTIEVVQTNEKGEYYINTSMYGEATIDINYPYITSYTTDFKELGDKGTNYELDFEIKLRSELLMCDTPMTPVVSDDGFWLYKVSWSGLTRSLKDGEKNLCDTEDREKVTIYTATTAGEYNVITWKVSRGGVITDHIDSVFCKRDTLNRFTLEW